MLGTWLILARRSTPGEWVVIAWILILALARLSLVCLYAAVSAAPGKEEVAHQLYEYSGWFGGSAFAIWLGFLLINWLLDR